MDVRQKVLTYMYAIEGCKTKYTNLWYWWM